MEPRQTELAQRIIDELHLEDIQVSDLDPHAALFGEGLGLDSIDALELAVIVERHYGVKIADMEVGRQAFSSLRALDAFIQKNKVA